MTSLIFKQCNANVPLLWEAIILRGEAARMLGYPNHAGFKIEERMAKTPKAVLDVLGDLKTHLALRSAKEIEHLKDLRKQDLKSRGLEVLYDGNYYLWDHPLYNRLMTEKEYLMDVQKIAEYFPLQSLVEGMLRIFEGLFGLVFLEVTSEALAKISETGKGEGIV